MLAERHCVTEQQFHIWTSLQGIVETWAVCTHGITMWCYFLNLSSISRGNLCTLCFTLGFPSQSFLSNTCTCLSPLSAHCDAPSQSHPCFVIPEFLMQVGGIMFHGYKCEFTLYVIVTSFVHQHTQVLLSRTLTSSHRFRKSPKAGTRSLQWARTTLTTRCRRLESPDRLDRLARRKGPMNGYRHLGIPEKR